MTNLLTFSPTISFFSYVSYKFVNSNLNTFTSKTDILLYVRNYYIITVQLNFENGRFFLNRVKLKIENIFLLNCYDNL